MDIKLTGFKLDVIKYYRKQVYFALHYRNIVRFYLICCQKAYYNIEADVLFYKILRVKISLSVKWYNSSKIKGLLPTCVCTNKKYDVQTFCMLV